MNSLKLTKLRFTLRFHADTLLYPFIGNTIRGAFGHALFNACCNHDAPRCEDCKDVSSCAYGSMFKAQNGESAPNPYVISAPYPSKGRYRAGDALEFSLTLCGSACAYEEAALRAVGAMCGGKLQNAALADACRVFSRDWSDCSAEPVTPCNTLAIRFITPTEIRSSGASITDISFALFMDSLLGRIAGIIDNYTGKEFTLPYRLIERKPFVQADCDTQKASFTTSGQPVDGIIGTVRYSGDITRYLPYIELGTHLHIGKKTTRGCGEYVIE